MYVYFKNDIHVITWLKYKWDSCQRQEVHKLAAGASQRIYILSIFQKEQDLDKLCVIHRYRPHSVDIAPITENGKVANYVMHVGSALHTKNYVEYYMKEGLSVYMKPFRALPLSNLLNI